MELISLYILFLIIGHTSLWSEDTIITLPEQMDELRVEHASPYVFVSNKGTLFQVELSSKLVHKMGKEGLCGRNGTTFATQSRQEGRVYSDFPAKLNQTIKWPRSKMQPARDCILSPSRRFFATVLADQAAHVFIPFVYDLTTGKSKLLPNTGEVPPILTWEDDILRTFTRSDDGSYYFAPTEQFLNLPKNLREVGFFRDGMVAIIVGDKLQIVKLESLLKK